MLETRALPPIWRGVLIAGRPLARTRIDVLRVCQVGIDLDARVTAVPPARRC